MACLLFGMLTHLFSVGPQEKIINIFVQENSLANVVCRIAAIFSGLDILIHYQYLICLTCIFSHHYVSWRDAKNQWWSWRHLSSWQLGRQLQRNCHDNFPRHQGPKRSAPWLPSRSMDVTSDTLVKYSNVYRCLVTSKLVRDEVTPPPPPPLLSVLWQIYCDRLYLFVDNILLIKNPLDHKFQLRN